MRSFLGGDCQTLLSIYCIPAVFIDLFLLIFALFSLQNRPFSPPVHSASPPPVAPLARAESTSSISSTNSMSAATTPTVGKELSVSVSGV